MISLSDLQICNEMFSFSKTTSMLHVFACGVILHATFVFFSFLKKKETFKKHIYQEYEYQPV